MEIEFAINMKLAIILIFEWVTDILKVFTAEPTIYFVGIALVGAVAGVARKFVPMRKR